MGSKSFMVRTMVQRAAFTMVQGVDTRQTLYSSLKIVNNGLEEGYLFTVAALHCRCQRLSTALDATWKICLPRIEGGRCICFFIGQKTRRRLISFSVEHVLNDCPRPTLDREHIYWHATTLSI